jgi:hypothetical protein
VPKIGQKGLKLPIQEAACRKKRKRGLETRTSVGYKGVKEPPVGRLTKVQGQWEPKKSAAKTKKTHPKEEDLSEEEVIAWVKVGKEGS